MKGTGIEDALTEATVSDLNVADKAMDHIMKGF